VTPGRTSGGLRPRTLLRGFGWPPGVCEGNTRGLIGLCLWSTHERRNNDNIGTSPNANGLHDRGVRVHTASSAAAGRGAGFGNSPHTSHCGHCRTIDGHGDLSHPCFAGKEERWPTTSTSDGFKSSSGD
jgi:hypothetical protein